MAKITSVAAENILSGCDHFLRDQDHFVVALIFFLVTDTNLFVANISFVMAEITFKVAVITSYVAKITLVVAEITFKLALITSLVVKITFVVV